MTRPSAIRVEDSPAREGPVFVSRRSLECDTPRRPAVTHSFAALAFHLDGRMAVEQRGRWTLERGDVLLVPAGEPHRMLEGEGPEIWGLGFCVPCFASEETTSLLEPFERVRAGASAVVRIPAQRHEFLLSLFGELERACTRSNGSSKLAVSSLAKHGTQKPNPQISGTSPSSMRCGSPAG
ncbi:MAG TPA: hypothetical protein VM869_29420, partial [Enhygromyxa sp.]|nr:hypothetical protein [Enhygromyxa sp.]